MNTRTYQFYQVDVFSDVPLLGNALAVVVDADDMTDEEMHRFARWTNLSETTFLLKPQDPRAAFLRRTVNCRLPDTRPWVPVMSGAKHSSLMISAILFRSAESVW